jgi:hypothetical protein
MAKLHKHSVQESLNTTTGGEWSVKTATASGSSANVNNTIHVALSATTGTLAVYSSVALHFNFSADSGQDVNASNDMIIPKETMMFFTVPRGLGNTVYFNHNSTTSSTGSVRIVEI